MTVAVIDGMGGGMGAEIVTQIRREYGQEITILALGVNAVATEKMIAARANRGASGENAIKYSINHADLILGPLGIVLPNGLMGEITKDIAETIMNSKCRKILIPVNHPDLKIIGLKPDTMASFIAAAVKEIKNNN